MSNLDARPLEQTCAAGGPVGASGRADATALDPSALDPSAVDPRAVAGSAVDASAGGAAADVEILEARAVPLGGTRAGAVAMTVRRTIPQRARSLVGAWCFCDHYGPDDVSAGPGMQVPPHPHTGLQTVTWLFAGEILHRDSVGSRVLVRPGQLNLMTAGRGVSHSEETPADSSAPLLHGVQLWVALPSSALDMAPEFEHHEDLPVVEVPGVRAHVLVGSLALRGPSATVRGTSPATVHTPLVGAQVDLEPGGTLDVATDPTFEHAVLVDAGSVQVDGTLVAPDAMAYVGPGRDRLVVRASGDGPARIVLLGGEPFAEEIVMWWNFVGRSHEDVLAAREQWQAGVVVAGRGDGGGAGGGPHHGGTSYAAAAADGRFGEVVGYAGGPLPAPVLPDVRLRPRSRPS